MELIPWHYPGFFLFLQRTNIYQLLQEAPCPLVYTSILMVITCFHFKIKIVQGLPYTEYRIGNVKVNQISLYGGRQRGWKELFSIYWVYSNLLLSFSLYLWISFFPLYQTSFGIKSGILMSFNVGYGISCNSFITLFNSDNSIKD